MVGVRLDERAYRGVQVAVVREADGVDSITAFLRASVDHYLAHLAATHNGGHPLA
jgi:hypothetical protein